MAYGTSASPDGNWTTCVTGDVSQTISSGDGLKTVYVRFKDGGDNPTSDYTKTITLDQTNPTTTVVIDNATYNSSNWVIGNTIKGTASDGGSGLSTVEVRISKSSGYWNGSNGWNGTSSSWQPATGTTTWEYSMDNQYLDAEVEYTVTARATDAISNTTSSGFGIDTFTYTSYAPPVGNIVQNVESGIVPVLISDWSTNLETTAQTGDVVVGVEDTVNANIKVAEMNVNFNSSPSWTGVSGATAQNVAFFHSTQPISTITNGAATSYTLYIRKGEGDKVWICPGAASLLEVNLTCSGGYFLSDGQTENGSTASVVTGSGGIIYWKVSGLTSTGGMSVVTGLRDTLTRLQVGELSDHAITFGTNYGLTASGDKIEIEFGNDGNKFVLGDLAIEDIEITDNVSFTPKTLSASAGVNIWGVEIDAVNSKITFNAPLSGTTGYFPESTQILIKIGTNVTGATHQIQNPSTVGNVKEIITLTNTPPNEMGIVSIPIVDSDTVDVSGYVNAYMHFDIDTATGEIPGVNPIVDCNYDTCLTHENGGAGSNYTVDLGELSSAIVNRSNTTSVRHADGGDGIINSIYFDVTTNAPSGAIVRVRSENGGLQGPGTNKILPVTNDGDTIDPNSGLYGYNLPVDSTPIHGTIIRNSLCDDLVGYCKLNTSYNTVFSTNNLPLDTGRVRMDLAAAATYVNSPGVYTDTLTFVATATF